MNRNNIRIDPMLEVDTKWNWPYIYAEIQLLLDGCEKFRISPDETLGLYASYSPVFRTVELEYFIEDERVLIGPFPYTPTDSERQTIMEMIEETCRETNGYSCIEFLLMED